MAKPIDLKPGNLTMDARSNPGDLDLKAFRYLKNVRLTDKGRLCRSPGFDKAFTTEDYNNQDLHDQLADKTQQVLSTTLSLGSPTATLASTSLLIAGMSVSGTGIPADTTILSVDSTTTITLSEDATVNGAQSITYQLPRAAITFGFEAISTRKTTKLILGTSKVLFALNNGTGNYKILSDAYGTEDTRWRAAQLEDIVVFSNNRDALVYWHFDQGISEDGDASVAPIPDLADVLKITRAGVVVAWKGTIFLMNVTVDGSVRSNGIYWCNYNNPLDWQEGDASTAGNADIDYGETILAALPLGNRLLVYTNKGIWEGIGSPAEPFFTFVKRYEPEKGENCLFYPRTLVAKGDEHVYLGEDGLYTYSLFMDKPQRPEWAHKATSVIFENINSSLCETHCAGYDTARKQIHFSYATGDNTIPNETLTINTQYPFASVLDHGFTCFVSFTARGDEALIRDFLLEKCICDSEELADEFGDFVEEGGFCEEQEEPECPDPPTSIYHTTTRSETYGAESVTVEDWEQGSAHADSLCAQLAGLTLQGFCQEEAFVDECNSGKKFLAASSTDYCLKEFSENYYREICTDFTECGTYSKTGYKTLLRSGAISAGQYQHEKIIHRLETEADFVEQLTPSIFRLRIGNHSQAIDSNNDNCGIVWDYQDDKEIACLSDDAETSATNATRPSETFEWPLYYEGSYLYYELSIENPDVSPVDTGGECCIQRISVELELTERRRF